MSSINTHIIQKHDTSENWTSSTYVPLEGEIILYTDLHQLKVGDGLHTAAGLSIFYHGTSATNDEIKDKTKKESVITPKNLNRAGLSWLCGKNYANLTTKADNEKTYRTGFYLRSGLLETKDESSEYNRDGFYVSRCVNTVTISIHNCAATSALPTLITKHRPCGDVIIPLYYRNSSSWLGVVGFAWISANTGTWTMRYYNLQGDGTLKTFTPSSGSLFTLFGTITYSTNTQYEYTDD